MSSIIFSLFCINTFNCGQLPYGRPSFFPSAFLTARASLVRMDIRLRSISATSPNANPRILLFRLFSKVYPSFVLWRTILRWIQVLMIFMMSINVLLNRETSVTIRQSPSCKDSRRSPSFRSLLCTFPLTTSWYHLSISSPRWAANFLISSCWFSKCCLFVLTRKYATTIIKMILEY